MKLVDIVGARPQFIKVGPVESGWDVLAGCDHQHILDTARETRPPLGSAAPCGDGLAGERIVSAIIRDAVQKD